MGIRPDPACSFQRMQHVTRASAAALLGLAMATSPLVEASTAYAADTGVGEGTLAVAASTAETHTFKVYKLLGGDLTKSGTMGYLSNVTTDGCLGDAFWTALDEAGIWDKGVIAAANAQSKAELIANKAMTDSDGTFTAGLARVVAKTASDSDVTATFTTGQSVTLPEGYYVILSDASQPALVAIGEGGETDITEKSVPPTVTKEINESRDGEDHWGKDADESSGNAMQYRLTGTINSNIKAYTSYEYAFVDEMDDALKVDTSTVRATLVPDAGDKDAGQDEKASDSKESDDKADDNGNVLKSLIAAILGPGDDASSTGNESADAADSASADDLSTEDKARNEATAEAAAKAGYAARETKVTGDGKTAYLKADGTPVIPESNDTIDVLCDSDGSPLSSTKCDGNVWTFHVGDDDLNAYAAKTEHTDSGEKSGEESDGPSSKAGKDDAGDAQDSTAGEIDLTQDAKISFEDGTLRVAWDDLKAACAKQGHELSATDKVVVTYEASLKDGATTGFDNPHENTVHIEYTHSPTTTELGKSVPDEANAYTYRIRVLKVSGASDTSPLGFLGTAVASAVNGGQTVSANSGQPLSGATFTLDGDGKTVTATSGADGTIEFDGLDAAVYKLTEVQAPNGYQPISGDITVELDSNITDTQSNDFQLTATATGPNTQVTDVDAKGGTATVTVSDVPNPTPETPQLETPQGNPGAPSANATATATSNPSDSTSPQAGQRGTAPDSQTTSKTSSAESMPQTGRGPIAALLTALAAAAAGLGFYFKRRAKGKVASSTTGKSGNGRSGKGA